MKSLLPFIFILCFFSIALNAQVHYVNHAATGNNNGSSWANAYTDLQPAIDAAAVGESIWVAAGTYLPTVEFDANDYGVSNVRNKTFYIAKNIEIYGGFAGGETMLAQRNWSSNTTILSGDIDNTPNDNTGNAFHVMFIDGTTANGIISNACIIDGFNIEKGNATSGVPFNGGGGIFNHAQGGSNFECSPSILNCSFSNNSAANRGGAIFNHAEEGTSSPDIINCSFSNNAAYLGGAVYNGSPIGESSPNIINCSFSNNSAVGTGGAIRSHGYPSGVCSPNITNCSFSNNTATTDGGAVYNFETTNMVMENCIFWDNSSTNGADEIGDGYISSNNTPNTNNTTLNYSIIDDGTIDGIVLLPSFITGTNNLDVDPLFINVANNNLRLQAGSPAKNVGNNSATGLSGITTDLDDNNRIIDGTVDMGSYESSCPNIIYVDATISGGDGTSWTTAFSDLQDAIDLASSCYGEIWVAAGSYLPTLEFDSDGTGGSDVREKTFYISKNVKIYGGFAGGETMLDQRNWTTNPTILSGDIDNTPNDNTSNAYHVMFIDGTTPSGATSSGIISNACIIDGFYFEKGNGNGNLPGNKSGGAIYNYGEGQESSPSILNCSFSNNTASSLGGAIFNNGSNNGENNPHITNCSFSNNTAYQGGAIYNYGLSGISNPNITSCSFSNNISTFKGGAIFNSGYLGFCSTQITNCSFSNNTTTGGGGAIFNQATTGITIDNCIFWNNSSTNGENEIDHTTNNNGNVSITLKNSILDDGTIDGTVTLPPNINGPSTNSDADPLFVDAPNNNLRLQPSSPAQNMGNNGATGLSGINTDLDNRVRIVEETVDMGAYEYQCPSSGSINIIYVNTAISGGDGLSWATAYSDLQDAIDLASICGGEIWVAAGTYLPTKAFDADASGGYEVREKTFYINKNIQIYGGFTGSETMLSERDWTINITTLSGDIDHTPNDNTMNAYHVMFIDGTTSNGIISTTCIVDGFNIEKGNAHDATFPHYSGSGIFNHGPNGKESSPSILNCSFSNNTVLNWGGAIYNNGFDNGVSSPNITNCSFHNNASTSKGGAIYNNAFTGTSSPNITNCSFSNNTAEFGGAIYNNTGNGSGVSSPNITNCSFSGNVATDSGDAIMNDFTSNVIIDNCIFWNNSTTVTDVIFENGSNNATTVNHSIFDDGTIDGTVTLPTNITGANNSDADPLFVDAVNNDLRLQINSPAKNTGNNTAAVLSGITTDLDGNNRIIETIVDKGAYENRCSSNGNIIYVNAAASSGGDGISWATAFSDLQDGIDVAYICGGEIWVAAGTYFPIREYDKDNPGDYNPRKKTFYISKDLKIYGGFDGTETLLSERDWTTNVTILSGDIGTLTDNSDNAYHIVFMNGTTANGIISNACTIDGFTIENGNANGGFNTYFSKGGAIYNYADGSGKESSPSILNCSFSNNTARSNGGAVYNYSGSGVGNPIFTDCSFSNNTSLGGGAVYNFSGQLGEISPSFTNCSFSNNKSYIGNNGGSGGAVMNHGNGMPNFTNCSFTKNTAYYSGGAIGNYAGNSQSISPKYTNCSFSYNNAGFAGGNSKGAAISHQNTTNAVITNCIFWNNGSFLDEIGEHSDNGTTLNYSIIDDETIDGIVTLPPHITGSNNSDADPLFVDAQNENLRLQTNSPAKNMGNNAAAGLSGITTDLDGNNRIIETIVDMGAYENQCSSSGNIIYVNAAASSGGDGISWTTAFSNLQDGIDLACVCGGEIWVAAGTYIPTQEFDADNSGGNNVREKTFYINKDIQIYGGFDGTETILSERDWTANITILSGDIGTPNNNSDNAYHVVFMNGTTAIGSITTATQLDGFFIEKGTADGSNENNRGGGIYNKGNEAGKQSSPSILNCIFSNNTTTGNGGSIYNNGQNGESSPIITNCTFHNNTADSGGAMYNYGNGGISSPIITNSIFHNNTSTNNGGAVYSFGDGGETAPLFINSLFYNNTTTYFGGAFGYDDSNTGTARFTNCTFVGNNAGNGGVIGIHYWDSGQIALEFENCIGWNNSSTFGSNGTININSSLIQESSCPTGVTCMNTLFNIDPLFVDIANNDFRLENFSPAIDVGNNNATGLSGITTDLDDNPRIASPNAALMFVDLGAYEIQTITGTDTDMDGIVDGFDNCPNSANASLHLDGTNDYVSVPHNSNLNFTGDFTVEAWINASSWKANIYEGTIVGKDGNVNSISSGYVLRCGNNGQLSFVVGSGTGAGSMNEWPEALSSQNALSLNTWHHVVGVLNGFTLTIYIDGVEAGSTAITEGQFGNSPESLLIGDSPAFPGRHFNGKVDEVRLWNTVRTEQELRGNLLQELSGSQSNLVAYYKFNEGIPNANNTAVSSNITDHSSNMNNGTLTNSAKTGTVSNWVFGAPLNLLDSDNDGAGDECDICPGFDDRLDADLDGIPDGCDCEITNSGLVIGDCVNDEFSIQLNVTGTNIGASYSLSGDITDGPYLYGQTCSIANLSETVNFTITDMTGNCSFQVTADAPSGCGSIYDCTENDLVFDDASLESGTYSAINTITSESTIESPKVVIYQAGMDIKLEPGFVAEAGSDFTAEIVACNIAFVVEEDNEVKKDLSEKETTSDDLEEELEAVKKETLTPSLSLYPNPTNRLANIVFTISESSNNTLAVYNNTGTMIKLLADNQWMEQGEYIEELDVERLPAGIYVVVLHMNQKTITKKLIVVE